MAFPHVDIIMKQKDRILWIKNHCERLVELLSTDQNGLKDQVTIFPRYCAYTFNPEGI